MSFTCFKEFEEIFLYGNIKMMEDVNVDKVQFYFDELQIAVKKNTQWCIFNNLKYLISTADTHIIEETKTCYSLLHFVEKCLSGLRDAFSIQEVTVKDEHYCGVITYSIVDIIYRKVEILHPKMFSKVKEIVNYTTLLEKHNVYSEYNITYGNWTSKHIFIVDDEKIYFHVLDIYLDNLFINDNFKYSSNCIDFIPALKERLEIVDRLSHYRGHVFDKLYNVTTKIYNMYPLNLIYNQYQMLNFENVYYPTIYEKIGDTSDTAWLFSILNVHCRCYLLGIAAVTKGVVSEDLQVKKIKAHLENASAFYASIYTKNKNYIDMVTEDLTCGNGCDEEGPYDVLFNHVYNYNIDDILIVFSHSTYHLFTCSEFEQLAKKKMNPYNREKITTCISQLSSNLEWKNKNIYRLNRRYIQTDLNGTLEDNFNAIKTSLEQTQVRHDMGHIIGKTAINLLMNII